MARLERGSPVAPAEVAEARRQLFATGIFRSVVPDTERRAGGDAAVIFEVEERPRLQLAYGLRWESSEGAGTVVDFSDRNAFGRGVTLGARALWSSDDESARFYSAFPKVFGTQATLELYAEGREFRETGESDALATSRSEVTLQVSFPLSRRTTARGYFRYRDSHIFEEDPDPLGPGSEPAVDRRVKSPLLGWQLLHDTRDNKIDAARGLFTSLDLTGSGEYLSSDLRFVRFLGKLSAFRQIAARGGRPLTWAQSWRLGLEESYGGQPLDLTERFFAGGEYSVRGYRNDSLGRQDAEDGTALGGEALLVVNQELRFPLWRDLRGQVFFDAGNVWDTASDFGSDVFTSAGLGLRYSSPVGLLRLDVAFPLDRRPDDDDFKVYVGLGNIF